MRASSPLIANETCCETKHVRAAKHLLSRAALAWFLATPPNGGLACGLIYQWRGSRGGSLPYFFETSPTYLRVWIRHCLLLSLINSTTCCGEWRQTMTFTSCSIKTHKCRWTLQLQSTSSSRRPPLHFGWSLTGGSTVHIKFRFSANHESGKLGEKPQQNT